MNLKALALVAGLWLVASGVYAQTSTAYRTSTDEAFQHINAAKGIGSLGDNLFGDSISDYTGSVQFSQVDVSLPGNSALPVSVGRRYLADDKSGLGPTAIASGIFGDWDLDIPHMHGIYVNHRSMTAATTDRRCDAESWHDAMAPIVQGSIQPDDYHRGKHLYLPGQGDDEVLWLNDFTDIPTGNVTYKWVTKGFWFFSCLEATDTPTTVFGDAFLARAPDGTKYWFDHVVQRWYPAFAKPTGALAVAATTSQESMESSSAAVDGSTESSDCCVSNIAAGPRMDVTGRNDVWILPSRVEDRFGNSVRYYYDSAKPWQLIKIESSDARVITLAYTNGRVTTVSDGTHLWTYGYNASGYLTSVTLPDGSQWAINFSALNLNYYSTADATRCEHPGSINSTSQLATITHPSGAQGAFTFQLTWHGRQNTWKQCQDYKETGALNPYYTADQFPAFFPAHSLMSKQISGPGMTARTWSWGYPALSYSYEEDCGVGCPTSKQVMVTQPDGSKRRLTFGTTYAVNEGLLLKSEVLSSADIPISTTTNDYVTAGTGQVYPAWLGQSVQDLQDPDTSFLKPIYRRQLVQDDVTFAWQVDKPGAQYKFDKHANPTQVTRSSTGSAEGSFSRTETTTYHDDPDVWVLGQVKSVKVSGAAYPMTETVYDPDTALPTTIKKFNVVQQNLSYTMVASLPLDTDGTLASVDDGVASHAIDLSNWKRGIPQSIAYPTTPNPETAVVDALGQVKSTTDETGASHSYNYDSMGRLASLTYPVGDTSNGTDPITWNGTTLSFSKVTSATEAPGIAVGQWKRVVGTGSAQAKGQVTTYLDAQWRPVLVLTEDTNAPASKTYVVHRYDLAGRESFVSYPRGSLTSSEFNSSTLAGTTTQFDLLGRVTSVQQTAESPYNTLTTTTQYLSGFKTRVTNPRSVKTETTYQVFDTPSTDAPVTIIRAVGAPEEQKTKIVRDIYGKPKSITRSGNGG
jgi:YD repeat-containing protein